MRTALAVVAVLVVVVTLLVVVIWRARSAPFGHSSHGVRDVRTVHLTRGEQLTNVESTTRRNPRGLHRMHHGDALRARIINGTREGGPHAQRWGKARRACLSLGFEGCYRSPAVYSDTPAYTDTCGAHPGDSDETKYVRGCTMAHRNALRLIAGARDRGVIFEDDITLADAPAGHVRGRVDAFLKRTAAMDVAYIGHCFNRNCAHALAWTPVGARKALDLVDWCSDTPHDDQIAALCRAGKLKCAYAEAHDLEPKHGSWGDSGSLVYQHAPDGVYH